MARSEFTPVDVDAEAHVVAALLTTPDKFLDVADKLVPDDFGTPQLQLIYQAILACDAAGQPFDQVTVAAELRRMKQLRAAGGKEALERLVGRSVEVDNVGAHVEIVREKSLLRRSMEAGREIVSQAMDPGARGEEVVEGAEKVVFALGQRDGGGSVIGMAQAVAQMNAEMARVKSGEMLGVPTGFTELDKLTSGLQPGQLILIGGRPGAGKCLPGDTLVVDPATGARRRLEDVVADGQPSVLSLADSGRIEVRQVSDHLDNGIKDLWRVTTALGRTVRATANHPLLTPGGWKRLDELEEGDLIAVPRRLPVEGTQPLPQGHARLLGHMIGDGTVTAGIPRYTSFDPETFEDLRGLVEPLGAVPTHSPGREGRYRLVGNGPSHQDVAAKAGVSGATVSRALAGGSYVAPPTRQKVKAAAESLGYAGRDNPVQQLLDDYGVWGHNAHTKHVPDAIFTAPNHDVSEFLAGLWAADGYVSPVAGGRREVSLSTVSRELAEGVAHLLLRLGVVARVRERRIKYDGRRRLAYNVEVKGVESRAAFGEAVRIPHSYKQERLQAMVRSDTSTPNPNRDLLDGGAWTAMDEAVCEAGLLWADVSERTGRPRTHNWHRHARRPSRYLVAEVAGALEDPALLGLATSDIYWDQVTGLERAGRERVYDLTVPGEHCFVADDVIVHNSAVALQMARYIAETTGHMVPFLSYEMSANELTFRLLATAIKHPLQELRAGRIRQGGDHDIGKEAARMAQLPLLIDDAPPPAITGIRSSMRRLARRGPLGAVFVDYLQLLRGESRTDNRVQELSEISRGLKMLASELGVPVIAGSQLSRASVGGPGGGSAKPALHHLRDSGCLTADTRLLRADTGGEVTLGELVARKQVDLPVWSVDPDGRMMAARLTRAFSSGHKQVHRLVLASGRSVKASANHRFLTSDGWQRLDQLTVGSRLAVPGRVPTALQGAAPMGEDELEAVARFVGVGGAIAEDLPPRQVGADGAVILDAPPESDTAVIPARILGQDAHSIEVFLARLWQEIGGMAADEDRLALVFDVEQRRLAHDVQLLLARLGTQGRIIATDTGRVLVAVDDAEVAGRLAGGARRRPGADAGEAKVVHDEVVAIEPLGVVEVFDATVEGTHNFVANGIVAHNSLEQDASVVMLMHRPYASGELGISPKEATLILAKQRNGPAGVDIALDFEPEWATFYPSTRRQVPPAPPPSGRKAGGKKGLF